MTQQESFKKLVRARMVKTGERYTQARRSLVEKASHGGTRPWKSDPEVTDERVRAATGRGWDEWCDVIEAWPGHVDGHAAIAAYLADERGVDRWWSQTVTVGYERIVGIRLPHQRSDGTFAVSKSKTIAVDPSVLRMALTTDDDRVDLFPEHATELQSRPGARTLRIAVGPGEALIGITDRGDGRCSVAVQHTKLPTVDDVDVWRSFWGDWLESLHAVGRALAHGDPAD